MIQQLGRVGRPVGVALVTLLLVAGGALAGNAALSSREGPNHGTDQGAPGGIQSPEPAESAEPTETAEPAESAEPSESAEAGDDQGQASAEPGDDNGQDSAGTGEDHGGASA